MNSFPEHSLALSALEYKIGYEQVKLDEFYMAKIAYTTEQRSYQFNRWLLSV